MYKLSERMQFIYDQLLPNKPVWDFCCDHGYMGLNAYESGRFPEVYFVDQVPHIVQQLEQRFHREYYREDALAKAFFLAKKGEDIDLPLTGTAMVAGVGAFTIFNILQELHQKGLLHAQRLILGPQRDELKLREMIRAEGDFGYPFCNEHYEILEKGRARKLLIFDKILEL
ncbi:tRNA (adenine(22)-N(1))-methyltransferase TrmK [Bdellovibrio bacteriovorus]|uniref:tRNA (adenine(22)-N(1))-methyltransferase TrmK n=1 Tax=Bdellovibrio bacteriovorus TaxID=959 RepID=UPI0035A5D1FC